MKLLLDVGNSRIKWAFVTSGSFVAHGVVVRDEEADLRPLFDTGQRPDEIRIANVAGGPAGARIAARLEQRFHVAPVFARSARTGAGVQNGYADSGQLGVDRWLAICAGYDHYRAAVCVVSAGTATTIDLVTDSGEHRGGVILPGLGLMELALMRGTSDLAQRSGASSPQVEDRFLVGPRFDPEAPVIALGRDTAAAMHYGALQATTSLVWACLEEFSNRASPVTIPPILLVTGGAASTLQAALRRMAGVRGALPLAAIRLDHRPQLVLEGLALDPLCFVADQ